MIRLVADLYRFHEALYNIKLFCPRHHQRLFSKVIEHKKGALCPVKPRI